MSIDEGTEELRFAFEKEMRAQGRDTTRLHNAYSDYGVVLSWWAAQWGYMKGKNNVK